MCLEGETAPTPRAWFDALPEAVVVADAAGCVLDANARCEALLGYSPGELRGTSLERVLPGHRASYRPPPREPERLIVGRAPAPLTVVSAVQRGGESIPVCLSFHPVPPEAKGHVLLVLRDARTGRALEETRRLQSLALEAAANGIVITDREGRILWVNPAACAMTGYSREELVGQRPSLLKSGEHEPEFYGALWRCVVAGEVWHGRMVNRRRDGSLYHEEQTIAPMRDELGNITHFIAIKQDVTSRVLAEYALRAARDELGRRVAQVEQLHAQLREQAVRDALTGLFNRRYLDETLPRELAGAIRERQPLCLVLLDVDHFKQINDRFGHAAGDEVLIHLAGLLRERSRAADIACRYGGEEFVVVLRGAALEAAVLCAEDWRSSFQQLELDVGVAPFHSTLSAGVAEWHPLEPPSELLARADAAMYRAKTTGRNRVVSAAPPPYPPLDLSDAAPASARNSERGPRGTSSERPRESERGANAGGAIGRPEAR